MPRTVKEYLDRHQMLASRRNYWLPQWQLVAEFIHQRKADFQTSRTPGAFISSHLWTDDPVHIAETSASAFLGYVWGAGTKSFRLIGNPAIFDDQEMRDFWNETTDALRREMADKDAGLAVSLDETMLELLILGTGAICVEERNQDKPRRACLLFDGWSLLEYSLAEGASGRAEAFYREREYKVGQLVDKFKIENVSEAVRKKFNEGKVDECVRVLHVIEPRSEGDRKKESKAAKDMPVASMHIEVETRKILKESGYFENPVACARLAKRLTEEYGRGRGMNALPSILMLNQVWEDFMLAMEKNLDPPMYQVNDAVTGNGYIDTSAGAINILHIDKAMPNVPPTGKLFDIQDIRNAPEIIDKLTQTISQHFMIDRLIDLNNDVQMTKGEAFLRNSIRQSTLRSPVSRILLELFDPLIDTSFNICLRRNKFGYMPGDPEARALEDAGLSVRYLPDKFIRAMEREEDLYIIEYLTPAARDMMADEGQGMVEVLAIAGQMAGLDESVPRRIDTGWTLERLAEIKGASSKMFRDEAEVQQEMQQMAEERAEMQQMASAKETLGVAKEAALAQNAVKA